MKTPLTILFCLLLISHVFAQESPPSEKKVKYRKTMPVSLELGVGLNNSKFIDFATSPIYYQGTLRSFNAGIRKVTDKKDISYAMMGSFGSYSMDYNDVNLESQLLFGMYSFHHSRLYRLNVFPDNKWNLKVGPGIDILGMLRSNPGLQNNSVGYELFTNVFASGKITRDISNELPKKLWFIKFKPKQRNLAFQLNIGAINGAWRNKYIYSQSSAVYNEQSLLDSHIYKLFSGFRMSSRLDYEWAVFNKNTMRFSYLWDAMMSGNKDQDRLQLVNSAFLISFNIKLR